jgi:ribosomal protein S18 acetylase RimI-like enzyme
MSLSTERLRALAGIQANFWTRMAERLYRQDGIQAWSSGLGDGWMNGVLATELAGTMPDRAIAGVAAFFRSARVPWTWSVTPLCRPRDLGGLLQDAGFDHQGSQAVLFHDRPGAAPADTSGFDIRPVRSAADLARWTVPLYDGFGAPATPEQRFRDLTARVGLEEGAPFQHFVGYQDGEPAACITLSVGRHGAGIDNLATCARFRRRGWGSALVRHTLAEARRLGCDLVCLEPTDLSLELYRRLGFRDGFERQLYVHPGTVGSALPR